MNTYWIIPEISKNDVWNFVFATDSCTTAKCGPHKRCVMRSGQPKCVCAPKCKAVNRVKKVNRSNYEQQHHHHQHHQKYNTLAYSRSFRSENDRRKSLSKKSRRQPLDATTAHSIDHHMSDVQILFGTSNGANQTTAKSDRMIAIAPALITNPNGHRFKKRKSDSSISHATHINGKLLATRKLVSNNNNNILNDSNALHHDESFAMNKMQHMHRRHRTNIYSNYGNNITGNDRNHYRHRIGSSNEEDDVGGGGGSGMEDENNSWDDRIRSGFYGHDLPYPPFDVPVGFFPFLFTIHKLFFLLHVDRSQSLLAQCLPSEKFKIVFNGNFLLCIFLFSLRDRKSFSKSSTQKTIGDVKRMGQQQLKK